MRESAREQCNLRNNHPGGLHFPKRKNLETHLNLTFVIHNNIEIVFIEAKLELVSPFEHLTFN